MPLANMTVRSGSPQILTATIANGASLSDAQMIDGKLVGIGIPVAWTAAALTFQGSTDGVTFVDVWDAGLTATAVERTVASGNVPTAATRFLALAASDWAGINYLKVRSGTASVPVNQGAQRLLTLVLAG